MKPKHKKLLQAIVTIVASLVVIISLITNALKPVIAPPDVRALEGKCPPPPEYVSAPLDSVSITDEDGPVGKIFLLDDGTLTVTTSEDHVTTEKPNGMYEVMIFTENGPKKWQVFVCGKKLYYPAPATLPNSQSG